MKPKGIYMQTSGHYLCSIKKQNRNSFKANLVGHEMNDQNRNKTTGTHVPPQNSTEARRPPSPFGSLSSSSTGIPTDTTLTGSG